MRTYVLLTVIVLVSGCATSPASRLLEQYRQEFVIAQEPTPKTARLEIGLLKAIDEEHSLAVVREMISDKIVFVRFTGCLAAARLKDDRLVLPLINCLRSVNFTVSTQAAYALVKIGEESIKPVMTECRSLLAIEERTEAEDWALFHCFSIFRQLKAKEATSLCIKALSVKSKRGRYAALGALKDTDAKEALPQILAILRNTAEPSLLRLRAIRILSDWQVVEATDDLMSALKDESEDVRQSAAKAFKKIKTTKAIPALIEAITDKSQKISAEAIRALYFQTGQKLTADFLSKDTDRQKAQEKWRKWWEQNKDKFK